jgi:hypothetical protein
MLNRSTWFDTKLFGRWLQTLNENQFSKQLLKNKQWQKNLSRGINPT